MKVLVLAAHPDDEVLGVGGTIAYHVDKGDQVYVAIVTEGSSTQYDGEPEKILQKKEEAEKVKSILGISKVIYLNLPDMKLDTLAKIEINKRVNEVISTIKPDTIYTHFFGDINSDHHAVFEATMVASRPVGNYTVKKILCYFTPSSTEWAAQTINNAFLPNVYVDISKYIKKKLSAMDQYKSELRPYPHPRSLEALTIIGKYWGQQIGVEAAEPFMLIREIND